MTSTSIPRLAMTIDVEDWFHSENMRSAVPRSAWESVEWRVERNTHAILDRLDEHRRTATFFVLGSVAERCPSLVRRIVTEGHELASHGYGHDLIERLTPDDFQQDVTRAKHLLEDLSGVAVNGYRAPCFSINDRALEILRDVGHGYDSSWFPVTAHDRYGRLDRLRPEQPIAEVLPGLIEVSLPVLRLLGLDLPWGGGGYFRLMPYALFDWGLKRIVNLNKLFVFYIHPWEFDPDQPIPPGLPSMIRFRHRINLSRTMSRWERLLSNFAWTSIAASKLDTADRISRLVTPI